MESCRRGGGGGAGRMFASAIPVIKVAETGWAEKREREDEPCLAQPLSECLEDERERDEMKLLYLLLLVLIHVKRPHPHWECRKDEVPTSFPRFSGIYSLVKNLQRSGAEEFPHFSIFAFFD